MNEPIKQLKQQAGIDFNPDQEGLDLFARLIVERVISVYNDSDTFKTSTFDDNRVLEYFGIKE